DLLGTWHPLAGSMYEPDTHYLLLAQPHHVNIHTRELSAALIGKILPSVALRWLADSPDVFAVWWEAIVQEKKDNILTQLIQTAAERINYAPFTSITIPITEPHQLTNIIQPIPLDKTQLLQQLMDWLHVQQSKISIHKTKAPSFRVEDGFLV